MLNLRKCGQAELGRAWPVFDLEFDKKELLPRLAVRKAMLKGDMELLAIYDEESRIDVAYALTACRGAYGYVLLKYFTVLPWYREKGLGVQAMRLINKRYADRQGILAELTDFSGEEGEPTLRALRKFFARFGYVELDADEQIGGVRAHVMVKPLKGTAEIQPIVHRVLRDFYDRMLLPVDFGKLPDIRARR